MSKSFIFTSEYVFLWVIRVIMLVKNSVLVNKSLKIQDGWQSQFIRPWKCCPIISYFETINVVSNLLKQLIINFVCGVLQNTQWSKQRKVMVISSLQYCSQNASRANWIVISPKHKFLFDRFNGHDSQPNIIFRVLLKCKIFIIIRKIYRSINRYLRLISKINDEYKLRYGHS